MRERAEIEKRLAQLKELLIVANAETEPLYALKIVSMIQALEFVLMRPTLLDEVFARWARREAAERKAAKN